MFKIKTINLFKIILGSYFILAPFAVSDAINKLLPGIGLSLSVILFTFVFILFYFFKGNAIKLNRFEMNTILLFTVPITLSFLGILTALLIVQKTEYIEYVTKGFPKRLLLIIINIIIVTGLLSITHDWNLNNICKLIKRYYYGVLFFSMVGVWQFFHFMLGIPYLNLETRSHIHSVKNVGTFFINGRLTSFANEPSYLAPLAIDLMILSFLVTKKPLKPFLLGLFVLILSYSGGGYLNLIILIVFFIIVYLKYNGYKLRNKHFRIILSFLFVGVVVIIKYRMRIYNLLYPVLGRLDILFSINKHSRMFMIVMPFLWVFENGLINALVGYGPKSYQFINLTKTLPNDTYVHITSNNLFADTVFELGYIGVVSYLLVFLRFVSTSFKKIYNNKYYFIAMMLAIHLISSSIYRADFMQSRFWIMIFIILKLINFGNLTLKSINYGGEK